VSAAGVAGDVTKKKCCRPRNARKICPPQPQRTCKLPSFSEFNDYSLCIETFGAKDVIVNVEKRQAPGHSTGNCISSCSISSLNSDKRHALVDSTDKLCGDCSIEIVSQATDNGLGRHQRGPRCAARSAHAEKQRDRMSRTPVGLVTSTPQPQSVMTLSEYNEPVECLPGLQSEEMYNQLANCASQLQLFDDSAGAEIGTCSCLVVAQ